MVAEASNSRTFHPYILYATKIYSTSVLL